MRRPIGNNLGDLLWAWNEATSPYVARTDREHRRMGKLARAIDGRLKRLGMWGQWRELSNGARMARWNLSQKGGDFMR